MEPLTVKQLNVLRIIYEEIKDKGYPPSWEDIKEKLNVKSNKTVRGYLIILESKGYIKRTLNVSRGLQVIIPPDSALVKEF